MPHCQRPAPRRAAPLSSFEWLGRELLLAAAAFGLIAGLGWATEPRVCEQLGDSLADARDAALSEYLDTRCTANSCESIELISSAGCRARVRVIERRFDGHGKQIGVFRTDEGLEFSPLLERWRKRELLDDKQLLGFPGL